MLFYLCAKFRKQVCRACSFILILISCSSSSTAQVVDSTLLLQNNIEIKKPLDSNNVFLKLAHIQIIGNRKTKDYLIRREITIKLGDTISLKNIMPAITRSKELVYNTNLFAETDIYPKYITDSSFDLIVNVRERLYIYPSVQFHLIDRSFNEWVKVYNADLERVTYGARYTQYNLSGRRDVLRVSALTGYQRNLQLGYTQPYSNRKLTEGFAFGIGFNQIRELGYRTGFNNRFINYRNDNFIRKSFGIDGVYFSRKGYYVSQNFGFGLTYISFTDSFFNSNLTKEYYNKPESKILFPDISYSIRYVNTNNINYPLTGKIYSASLLKRGLGWNGSANMLRFDVSLRKFSSYGKNWYGTYTMASVIKIPFKQAFLNQRAIGFGNLIIRGLDTYVVDAAAAMVGSYTLRKKLFAFNIKVPIKNKYLKTIPFQFFAKSYTDFGYAYAIKELRTNLSNRFLYTGGVGVDMVTFYDVVVGVDYSANQLGEKGLFLRVLGGF